MGPVRFGVVGLGMGRVRARLVTETDGAVLQGVCDTDQERLDAIAEELGCRSSSNYDDLLADNDIDVIYVMTASGTHLDFVEKAAAAGKHVIVTKPMEVTVDRCRRLVEACRSKGVHLVVDLEMRYLPQMQRLKAAIDAGELGDIVFAEARVKVWRSQAYYDQGDGWRGTWALDGGGSLTNQGIHAVDSLVWLCGDPTVTAARSGAFNHRIEGEDLTLAILELPNGSPGLIMTTTCNHLGEELSSQQYVQSPFNPDFGVSISGTLGSASNLAVAGPEVRVKFEEDGRDGLDAPIPDAPKSAVEDMVRVLRDGASPFVPGEEGVRSVRLAEEVYRVARVRRTGN